jgi:hypothetical protein
LHIFPQSHPIIVVANALDCDDKSTTLAEQKAKTGSKERMGEASGSGDSDYSRFRDLLIPDAKNTLQSAAYAHESGDFERAERLLDAVERKVQECREQLQEDKQASQRGD